jgi:protoheme IX farnesyltransferase
MESISSEISEIQEAVVLAKPAQNGLADKLSGYWELTKPRIAFMLVLTAAAGFYVAAPTAFSWTLFAHSMIGITLLAFGVAALNQFWERKIDVLMERTAARPLPSGRVTSTEALVFGLTLSLGSIAYLGFFVNWLTAGLGIVVIVSYVLLYTPLKTRTPICTAVGAIPGAMPPLMGWTSSANEITLGALALFGIIFFWQFPHFLAIATMYKEQYENAGIKMLPIVEEHGRQTAFQIVLFAVLLLPVSIAPFFLGFAGIIYLIGALVFGVWFIYSSIVAARAKTIPAHRTLMLTSVLYLPAIFFLLVISAK